MLSASDVDMNSFSDMFRPPSSPGASITWKTEVTCNTLVPVLQFSLKSYKKYHVVSFAPGLSCTELVSSCIWFKSWSGSAISRSPLLWSESRRSMSRFWPFLVNLCFEDWPSEMTEFPEWLATLAHRHIDPTRGQVSVFQRTCFHVSPPHFYNHPLGHVRRKYPTGTFYLENMLFVTMTKPFSLSISYIHFGRAASE